MLFSTRSPAALDLLPAAVAEAGSVVARPALGAVGASAFFAALTGLTTLHVYSSVFSVSVFTLEYANALF